MVRSKYTFEKRQKENAKKKKNEEKAARRAEAKQSEIDTDPGVQSEDPDTGDVTSDSEPATPPVE